MATFAPGLYFINVGQRSGNPAFRGLVLNTQVEERQNSSIFVDGFFLSGSAATLGFNNIERVEVLKGPQSALFGRSTFGGAVNFITKSPSDGPVYDVGLSYGRFDEIDVAATMGGPIVEDKVAALISARYFDYGGHWRNTVTDEKVGQEQTVGLFGTLEFTPVENLRIVLRATYSDVDDGVPASTLLLQNNCLPSNNVSPDTDGYFCGKIPDLKSIGNDSPGVEQRFGRKSGTLQETQRYSVDIYYDIDDWEVNLRGAWNQQDELNTLDAAWRDPAGGGLNFGGRLQTIHQNQSIADFRDKAAELRVSSPTDGNLYGFIGLSYFEQDIVRANLRTDPTRTANFQLDADTENQNYSVFGSLTYEMTDQWSLGFDWRYQEDTVEEMTGGVPHPPSLPIIPQNVAKTKASGKFSKFLPRFIVDYRANDDQLYYALLSRGNKPGFFNNAALAARLPSVSETVEEESIWNYEVGAKTEWLDNTLQANIVVYYIDWTNQQIRQTFIDALGQASAANTNTGKTTGWGFEFEGAYLVNENFTLNGTLAFSDLEYDFFVEETFAPQLGTDSNLEGNRPFRFPDWQGSISGNWVAPAFGEWDFFAKLDYTFTGKRWNEIYNLSYIGWEHMVNGRVGLESEGMRFSFWVDNLLNDNTPTGAFRFRDITRFISFANTNGSFSFPYNQQVQLGTRTQFGVSASFSF